MAIWKKLTLGMVLASNLFSQTVWAHPFSQEEYSLRTAITVSDKGIVPLVVLEIPIPIALKEIGAAVEDPNEVKRRKINAYNKLQWDTLSENVTFTVNGENMKGQWLAIEHPANGKAAEGFFVYMVSFQFDKPMVIDAQQTLEVEINNTAFPDAKMVYSGSALAKEPWTIVESTARSVLGENENADLSDPKRWSTSAELRKMHVVVERSSN